MGVAPTMVRKGLGPQDLTKKMAHWVNLFGQQLTRKLVFKNFGLQSEIILNFLDLKHPAPHPHLVIRIIKTETVGQAKLLAVGKLAQISPDFLYSSGRFQ